MIQKKHSTFSKFMGNFSNNRKRVQSDILADNLYNIKTDINITDILAY